jgi:hypothetical protein
MGYQEGNATHVLLDIVVTEELGFPARGAEDRALTTRTGGEKGETCSAKVVLSAALGTPLGGA